MKDELEEKVRRALEAAGVRVRKSSMDPRGAVLAEAAVWELGPKRRRVVAVERGAARLLDHTRLRLLPRIYIKDHIAERLGERWIHEGLQFADASGNAHIDVAGLKVRILGMRPSKERKTSRPSHGEREWRGAALRILFHLLSAPEWIHQPIRELAARTESTPRTVSLLFDDLERSGNLVRSGRSERRLHLDTALFDRWVQEYQRKLRPRTDLGRYRAPEGFDITDLEVRPPASCWGGESAAARLGANLRPGVETLYVRGSRASLIKSARLRPDPGGPVELRRAFWSRELPGTDRGTAPPLLVVADLDAVRSARCYDAANEIRERYLTWT